MSERSRQQAAFPEEKKTGTKLKVPINELTGLPERQGFLTLVEKEQAQGKLTGKCIVSIDIEHFKLFNNWYGQVEGDALLKTIGRELANCAKEKGYIAGYFGGDDFFLCMTDEEDLVQQVYDLVFHCLVDYQQLEGFLPMMGVCTIMPDASDISVLCNNAQIASSSVHGKLDHRICRFADDILKRLEREQRLLSDVRVGISRGEFTFYLQPKCNSTTSNIVSMEALARWNHPERGWISPGEFIPVLESSGLVTELDCYIWESVCKTMSRWLSEGRKVVPISVNVSITDIKAMDIPTHFRKLVTQYNLDPNMIRVEITETAFAENSAQVRDVVERLHQNGFVVLMDDFGSGYSSLNMLKDTSVDVLKLDMKLIDMDSENRMKGIQIIDSIVSMAHKLRMGIVAEGVETKEQVDMLKSMNCLYGQGYYFYRPMSVEDAERLMLATESEDVEEFSIRLGTVRPSVPVKRAWTATPEIEQEVFDTLNDSFLLLGRLKLNTSEYQILKRTDPLPEQSKHTQKHFALFNNEMALNNLIHPDDLDAYQQTMAMANLRTEFFSGRKQLDFRFRLYDGEHFSWVEMCVMPTSTYTPQHAWVLFYIRRTDALQGMEEDRRYRQELEYVCSCDSLTGLFNRAKFEKDIAVLKETMPSVLTCVYMDVVGLHEINNHLGHQMGDSMLCMVAGMSRSLFQDDMLYRIGGDEFVVLCKERTEKDVLLSVEKLRMMLRASQYEISIGVAQGGQQDALQLIINQAENAMLRDKNAYYQQHDKEARMNQLNEKLEQLMQEKRDEDQFIRVIAPEYMAVCLINLAQDAFRKILLPDYFREMLESSRGSFVRAIREYVRIYIVPEDQSRFLQLLNARVVRQRLEQDRVINERYRRNDGMNIKLRILPYDMQKKNDETIWIFAQDTDTE